MVHFSTGIWYTFQSVHTDDRVTWCQNRQTKGIPIGPDTSLIISEIIGCHLDRLFTNRLKKKNIKWIGYRYYDDYLLYFNSELDAQIGLKELREVLSEFELTTNDDKTAITLSSNELEREWVHEIKSFFFRPNDSDQKEDIWSFFSIAFKFAKLYPKESVLKLALNKFTFIRIEKSNWYYFESLLFRLALTEPACLQKVSKILITYKSIVTKNKLKRFCFEMINRAFNKNYDYEMTWALWLLQEFKIQPTKQIYLSVFKSQSVCGCIIALNLISQNSLIKNISFHDIEFLFSTDNLNSKYWMLVYETIYKGWLTAIPSKYIDEHFFFSILRKSGVYFYDDNIKLEPLKVEKSYFDKIEKKITQLKRYLDNNTIDNERILSEISAISKSLAVSESKKKLNKLEIQTRLTVSELRMKSLLEEIENIKKSIKDFTSQKIYFAIGKKIEELNDLTNKEIALQNKEESGLLFDPEYD